VGLHEADLRYFDHLCYNIRRARKAYSTLQTPRIVNTWSDAHKHSAASKDSKINGGWKTEGRVMSIHACRDARCNGIISFLGLRVARSVLVCKQTLCASILQLSFF
jgi:hypothetical protein